MPTQSRQPTIEFQVRNDTDIPISQVSFFCIVITPGRVIPWLTETAAHSVPGGIEPGESARWDLRLGLNGWTNIPNDRNDYILIAKPYMLYTGDNQLLANRLFSTSDARLLREALDITKVDNADSILNRLNQWEAEDKLWKMNAMKAIITSEIETLQKLKATTNANINSRNLFSIQTSLTISTDRRENFPIINFSIDNKTGVVVTQFDGTCSISSPSRPLPWGSDKVGYRFPSGLKHGEQSTKSLDLNITTKWGNVPVQRNDLVLTYALDNLYGLDGKPIFPILFSPSDQERLDFLEKFVANNAW